MNRRTHLAQITLAILTSSAGIACGQYSGNASATARCGTTQDHAFGIAEQFTLSSAGQCPAPRFSTPASDNDAMLGASVASGDFRLRSFSHTNFYGTQDDAGSASSFANFFVTASDVVFTSIANPSQTGNIDAVSLNYEFAEHTDTVGSSNCTPFQPQAHAYFVLSIGPCNATGARNLDPSIGVQANDALIGYPNDGSYSVRTTSAGLVDLTNPKSFFLQLSVATSVLYCDSPPAAIGSGDALMALRFPCDGPVFNLPPGYTVNSTQLGIVNNRWVGRSCCDSIDFNGDSLFPDTQDIDDFLSVFSGGPCSNDPNCGDIDFNNDGLFPDTLDIDSFLSVFSGGACL